MDKKKFSIIEAERGFRHLQYLAWKLQGSALKLPPTLIGNDFFISEPARKVVTELQRTLDDLVADLDRVDDLLKGYWDDEIDIYEGGSDEIF